MQQRPGVRVRQPAPATGQPAAATTGAQVEEPPSPASSTSSSQFQREVAEELSSPKVPKAAPPVAGLNNQMSSVAGNQKPPVVGPSTQKSSLAGLSTQKSNPTPQTNIKSASTEADPKKIQAAAPSSSSANENGKSPTKETIMEESIRVTRGRLRKTRSSGTQ